MVMKWFSKASSVELKLAGKMSMCMYVRMVLYVSVLCVVCVWWVCMFYVHFVSHVCIAFMFCVYILFMVEQDPTSLPSRGNKCMMVLRKKSGREIEAWTFQAMERPVGWKLMVEVKKKTWMVGSRGRTVGSYMSSLDCNYSHWKILNKRSYLI